MKLNLTSVGLFMMTLKNHLEIILPSRHCNHQDIRLIQQTTLIMMQMTSRHLQLLYLRLMLLIKMVNPFISNLLMIWLYIQKYCYPTRRRSRRTTLFSVLLIVMGTPLELLMKTKCSTCWFMMLNSRWYCKTLCSKCHF